VIKLIKEMDDKLAYWEVWEDWEDEKGFLVKCWGGIGGRAPLILPRMSDV
jgi:hypothetical protein